MKNNYYKDQLKDIFVSGENGLKTQIKFIAPNNNTNWINLNNESLPIIIDSLLDCWLENLNLKS
tara:strand:+ start:481 stop:672 length:192 start_codon:yes stop_codon:yes gene_type:complete